MKGGGLRRLALAIFAVAGVGGLVFSQAKLSKEWQEAALKVYVPPGEHDEFYAILSGGFNGQIGIYGLPSGRLFRIIPVLLTPKTDTDTPRRRRTSS